MMHEFQTWSTPKQELAPLAELQHTTIAIEARFYLNRFLTPPSREPLLAALGGLPFALRDHISQELEALRSAGITPLFIFEGLGSGKKYGPFDQRAEAAASNGAAWDLYAAHQAERAVEAFGKSGYVQPEDLYSLLQQMLVQAGIDFQVAPYSAWGQLAYLSTNALDYIDAIAGSHEILLYDVDKVITKLDLDQKQIAYLRRQTLIEDLNNISQDMFIDAAMLAGSSILPPLPLLSNNHNRRHTNRIRQAVDLMKGLGQTGISVCTNYQEDAAMKSLDYLDRFRRTKLALKHQVVLTVDGKIESLEASSLPNDAHEFLGQRLPDELYYYLSKGAVSTELLNQMASGHIYEVTPVDGGESEAYRTLVSDKLNSLRQVTLSALACTLHRAYMHREVKLTCWFAPQREIAIRLNEIPRPDQQFSTWNVPQDLLQTKAMVADHPASIATALAALKDSSFAQKTITPRKKDSPVVIMSKVEVEANAMFRFLHLRGYVDDQHKLTSWGTVLEAVLSRLGSNSVGDDAALLAVELLRLDMLRSDNMFPSYSGLPMRGSDADKTNTLLLSRIACLCRLRHQSIGFTGPLSRQLLGYTSMVNSVRQSLRNLIDASLVTMFLAGDAERDCQELSQISIDLPLLFPYDCALAIAMKHYLDELPAFDDPTAAATKEAVFEKGSKEWLQYSLDFKGDLQRAFAFWDAIFAGILVACAAGLVKNKSAWEETNKWVLSRR